MYTVDKIVFGLSTDVLFRFTSLDGMDSSIPKGVPILIRLSSASRSINTSER